MAEAATPRQVWDTLPVSDRGEHEMRHGDVPVAMLAAALAHHTTREVMVETGWGYLDTPLGWCASKLAETLRSGRADRFSVKHDGLPVVVRVGLYPKHLGQYGRLKHPAYGWYLGGEMKIRVPDEDSAWVTPVAY